MYFGTKKMASSASENRLLLSKIATNEKHGEDSPYFEGWKAYDQNPFHPTENPEGVIQMDLAENQLSFDLVEEWIRKNPKGSICTAEGIEKFRNVANFQDYMAYQSSDRPFLRSCRKQEAVESHLILIA
ncbi:1-aminocyclopropane-1-carboxylate synthase 1-like isoform X1 [Malus sylvestris]|uniref:1-aminocyclopropane-1-carboxylate synthase 1-like isoform X1 n=1 Tax=Malus sylvestris TaxID=3752 RepID=UPI0021AC549A|nr:1-aminocyclopropane-1-carboxylate synthase 1-like isoform X1 [Malus sylvestris]